jgi:hypothetical protein
MSGVLPLRPGTTATLAVTTTSANVAISGAGNQIEIQNAGGVTVFCRWGVGAQTAVATDYPVLAGHSKVVTMGVGNTNFAAICSAGTSTVYITTGEGA